MRLNSEKVTYQFCKTNQPAIKVNAPITMDIETLDCFSNQLRDPKDVFNQLNWDRVNPATGPVYVDGAEPGDTLKVTINEIKLDGKGTVCCLNGEGALGHIIEGEHFRIVAIDDDYANYLDRYKLPLRKMIGVIGVAPRDKAISNGTPGKHGGNMDTTMITEGAILYLPVAVEGALFGLGDVHSVMGDGEIGVSGLETPAEINLTLELIKGKAPEYPVIENKESFAVVVSKTTIDEAISCATELMFNFLKERMDIETPEIIMLMSLVGDVQISQVVDPQKTARFVFPKKFMDIKDY